jgi:hypothetical protein
MFIRSQIYSIEYEKIINEPYNWPDEDMKHAPLPVDETQSLDEDSD